ncbi:hypothetical protein ACFPIJ_52490 [Dactylosporangium cerinum]|uniref:Uncharacterized protein n=1 Tax=Dactylosporangium cerinum TaxID=1434730 RepID=A0ABV9WDZ8_9ACTN
MRIAGAAASTQAWIARRAATANREASTSAQRRLALSAGVAAVLTVLLFAALITVRHADDHTWPPEFPEPLRAVHRTPVALLLDRGSWRHGWPFTTAANTWRFLLPAVWPAFRPSVWPCVRRSMCAVGIDDPVTGR